MALSTPERRQELASAPAAQKEARERMALFPMGKGGHGSDGHGGEKSEVIFVEGEKWVPVVRLGGKVCALKLMRLTCSSAFSLASPSSSSHLS